MLLTNCHELYRKAALTRLALETDISLRGCYEQVFGLMRQLHYGVNNVKFAGRVTFQDLHHTGFNREIPFMPSSLAVHTI